MNQHHAYKSRTVEVRNSARAHLKALRAQRMQKRQPAPVEDTMTSPSHDKVGDAENVTDAVGLETDSSPELETAVAAQTIEGDALNDLAVANAAMSEMSETVGEPLGVACSGDPSSAEPDAPPKDALAVKQTALDEGGLEETPSEEIASQETGLSEPVPDQVLDQEPEVAASDLNTLPGAGPGLVWMLHQCGIESLSDLAETTPEKLANDLGVVGQILDVSLWVDFAKKHP